MQMPDTNLLPLSSLPLPAAALAIDMRGGGDDSIMERLKIEIADLTGDMQIHGIHHWRYLADFISFLPKELCPKLMSPEEVNALRSENKPTGTIKQDIDNIINEISIIRSNHSKAQTDRGGPEDRYNTQDTRVRVIFLVDAELANSLATTALYAAYLKQYYRGHERDGQVSMISITVLCLNNSGEVTPSPTLKELLWENGWDHLDTLILSDSSRNGIQIAAPIQAHLADLLLYVLLIVPHLTAELPTPSPQTSLSLSQNTSGRRISLPPKTYSVGLASKEYSARWGRRLLNYKVVERIVRVIQQNIAHEEGNAENAANIWLYKERAQVKKAVPDQVPGNNLLLAAILRANSVIERPGRVLSAHTFGLAIGNVISNLQEYLAKIIRTYMPSEHEGEQAGSHAPTLQDAIDNIPLILLHLGEWESEDPDKKKGTPLFQAHIDTQRVLSDPIFFASASGAVSRGRLDLEELSKVIAQFESKHQQETINLLDKQQRLQRSASDKINALQQHIDKFPFLSSQSRVKRLMAWLTLFLTFCLCAIMVFVGMAWLRHLITYWRANGSSLPTSSIAKIMDSLLLVSVSPAAFVCWGIVLIALLGGVFFFGRRLLNQGSSPLAVEGSLCLSLTVFVVVETLIKPSIARLATDPPSAAVISWLSFLPFWGSIISIGALVVIAATELSYFAWWYYRLQAKGRGIVNEMNAQHKSNIEEVVTFIADSIVLKLLKDAELTSEKGQPGEYYSRILQLDILLTNILKYAIKQQDLAKKHLTQGLSDGQQRVATRQLNLLIREELLGIVSLTHGYSGLMKSLEQGKEELKEFSELLLRIMSKEAPDEIEQQFKARPAPQVTPEQHDQQILMATLAAIILRFFTVPANSSEQYIEQEIVNIIDQCNNIKNSSGNQPSTLRLLIDALDKKLSDRMLQPRTSGSTPISQIETDSLAIDALAAWAQIIWENKNPELDSLLTQEGVIPKILQTDNDVQEVKRKLLARIECFYPHIQSDRGGELYLFLPLSQQSERFHQDSASLRQKIISFPDVERLVLLYIERYVAEPWFIPD